MQDQLIVSTSPHIKSDESSKTIMRAVFISLLPTSIVSIYIFGWYVLLVTGVSILTCVAAEIISCKILKRESNAKTNGSAAVTGILLAFVLPPGIPLWMVAIGAITAILLAKQLFGGLGYNIFNPALVARAVLTASWPTHMTTWTLPVCSWKIIETTTSASPLGIIKLKLLQELPSYKDMLFGCIPGCIGETCKITLLAGALLLLIKKIIDWRIPVSFIGAVYMLSFIFGQNPLFEILSGGLILGAFFMATDMVTAPVTKKGKWVFGIGCGLITSLIRTYGGLPEGVCYSILFMNALSPLIDRYTMPKKFGWRKSAGN